MSETVRVKYTGSALPGNAETVSLFNTVTAFPGAQWLSSLHMKRLQLDLLNNQAGTLNWYKSQDRGVTWSQIGTLAVAAPAANTTNDWDALIEEYADFKLEWLNGATPQTLFSVDIALSDERNKGT